MLPCVNIWTSIRRIQTSSDIMAAPDPAPFPLVDMQAIANARNDWRALGLRVAAADGDATGALFAVFRDPDLLVAIAPLDCVLYLATPAILTPDLLELVPPHRVVLAIDAAALADPAAVKQLVDLHDDGYRIMLDGAAAAGIAPPPALQRTSRACAAGAAGEPLAALSGPHLAREVDDAARFAECAAAGFEWFSGAYPFHPAPSAEPDDGSSRKRLLAMLGLLARDADTSELELLLKQDPALSYHLLKLVNSAAFALSNPITSFGQAINLLGRRQLQRWLQLLLYARRQEDGLPNLLLPQAALRAAQMEALVKARGGDRDAQDIAFMVGVFSLLDVLFALPMDELVGALSLPAGAGEALLARSGPLGALLKLVETPLPPAQALQDAAITPVRWWHSQLHAHHWAIQVSRNL
jgi:EAL and modified HD-GYP domain-containing signal transduction protein